jgi:GDP-mannose 6-dehydrogenase
VPAEGRPRAAVSRDVELPLISQILPSNRQQIQNALDQVLDTGRKSVGLLGFSFKAGTDDLRESPIVILAEALLGKGISLKIYDKNVSLAKLVGANKEYIEKQIPHLSSLLCNTIDEVIDLSEVIVVGNQGPEFVEALTRTRKGQIVIDLVRLPIYGSLLQAEYRGICW